MGTAASASGKRDKRRSGKARDKAGWNPRHRRRLRPRAWACKEAAAAAAKSVAAAEADCTSCSAHAGRQKKSQNRL